MPRLYKGNAVANMRPAHEMLAICCNHHCRSIVRYDNVSNQFRCRGRNHLQPYLKFEYRELEEHNR